MNVNGMAVLLSEILETQLETGQYGSIDEQRLFQALTTGPALTDEEQSLLLLSPVARSDFKRIGAAIKKELESRVQEYQVGQEILPLAAATVGQKKVVFQGNGFTVTLYRQDKIGIPWVILVQLGSDWLRVIHPMTTLRLVDSGGLEWLRGSPDPNGEITATWDDHETDILARSRRFYLLLEPV